MAIDGPATIKDTVAACYGGDADFAALFTADPGTTGTVVGEVSGGVPAYARKPVVWGAPVNGVITSGPMSFDIPAGTTLTHVAVCSLVSGANLLDRKSLANVTFGAQGTYVLTLTFTEI